LRTKSGNLLKADCGPKREGEFAEEPEFNVN